MVFLAAAFARDGLAEARAPVPDIDSAQGIPILMYHKVNPNPATGGKGLRVNPAVFEKQMRYLAYRGYTSVSINDVVRHITYGAPLPPRPVAIAFDDGYMDNYRYAFPILKKYNITATIFVVSDIIGGTNDFDYLAGKQPLNGMMGWKELKEMSDAGNSIGSHTLSHARLTDISQEKALKEISQSKKVLEEGLGKPVEVFCYPYGNYNGKVAAMVEESGYLAAVTTDQGLSGQGDNIFALPRIRVTGYYDQEKFLAELTRYYLTYHDGGK